MRSSIIAIAVLFATAFDSAAVVWPKETECPLMHPENPSLRFVGAALDQHTDGPPWQPDGDREAKLPDGMIHIITHYASYEILRDAILICAYSEIRSDTERHLEKRAEIRIPLPGILMRCEGVLRDVPITEPNDWKRRWCVNDPNK